MGKFPACSVCRPGGCRSRETAMRPAGSARAQQIKVSVYSTRHWTLTWGQSQELIALGDSSAMSILDGMSDVTLGPPKKGNDLALRSMTKKAT